MCCGWKFTATCCWEHLLGSKRKLPPPACQVWLGLPSVVCRPGGVQFPVTAYICSHGPLSSAWVHCISCAPSAWSHCRRCCCCPLQCDRRRMETCLNSAEGPDPCRRSWSSSFLHLLSVLFFFHCFFPSQEPSDTFLRHRGPPKGPQSKTLVIASSTMMKRSRLITEAWWTPTFTSNSSLYYSPTWTQLRTFAYIPYTSRTIHSSTPSFLSAHQMTFRGTRSKAFSRSTKAM